MLGYGIETVRDFHDAFLTRIRDAYGSIDGERMWLAMHGHDVRWSTSTVPRSLSHSRVLERSMRAKAEPIARWLALCGWLRARNQGLRPGRVRVNGKSDGRVYQVLAPIQHPGGETEALRATSTAWRTLRDRCLPEKVSIVLDELSPDPWQHIDLVEEAQSFDRPVDDAIAKIRRRFGVRAVQIGHSRDPTGPYTGLKIAFERVPSLEEVQLFTGPVAQIEGRGGETA